MDQIIDLAGDTPEGQQVVKSFTSPQHLQLLIELSARASVRNQIMIFRILQHFMNLDLP